MDSNDTTMLSHRTQSIAVGDTSDSLDSEQVRPRMSYVPTTSKTETLETSETEGDSLQGGEGSSALGLHDEVSSPASGEAGGEGDGETTEASAEQMGAEAGEETAEADLAGIEGYAPLTQTEADAEGDAELAEVGQLIENGAATETEFFPILAALVPTLISAIGPAVAKGVLSKLRPRSRKLLMQLAKAGGAGKGSQNVLALVAKLLASGQLKPSGESGAEADAEVVEQAVATLEVIIGNDDRVRITQTTLTPWRRYCALRITFPNGRTFRGTGFFIGPRSVATAGHCVFMRSEGGWARKVEVIPGMNGPVRPFGSAVSVSLRSVGGWVNSQKPEADYGCVVLPQGAFAGRNLGRFGFAAFSNPVLLAQPAILAGFPGDKPFAQLWGMKRKIKSAGPQTLTYDIDTMGGQSGAPVYIKRNGARYVVGIHNYGATTGNSATRVTAPVYQRLLGWSTIS